MSGPGLAPARRLLLCGSLLLALLAAGCGGPRYPVAGRVLLQGKPLEGKAGAVMLKPDSDKGNKSAVSPVGVLQGDGTFSVLTNGKPGAPPGWYKVVISATDSGANPNEDAPPLLNACYLTEATTPLVIEVVPSPAADRYDLKLSP